MDPEPIPQHLSVPRTLYPTLFRWTSYSHFYTSLDLALYIPHCSDGPSPKEALYLTIASFISHIVQMDPILFALNNISISLFISHIVQMDVPNEVDKQGDIVLYIPHCSDGPIPESPQNKAI